MRLEFDHTAVLGDHLMTRLVDDETGVILGTHGLKLAAQASTHLRNGSQFPLLAFLIAADQGWQRGACDA